MSVPQFRLLLIIYMLVSAVGGTIDSLVPSLLPEALYEEYLLVEASSGELNLIAILLLSALVVGLGIASTIGLFLLKSWSRPLSVWLTAVLFFPALFLGPTLESAVSSAFVYLSTILWGAILALVYFSPLSEHFTSNAKGTAPDQ